MGNLAQFATRDEIINETTGIIRTGGDVVSLRAPKGASPETRNAWDSALEAYARADEKHLALLPIGEYTPKGFCLALRAAKEEKYNQDKIKEILIASKEYYPTKPPKLIPIPLDPVNTNKAIWQMNDEAEEIRQRIKTGTGIYLDICIKFFANPEVTTYGKLTPEDYLLYSAIAACQDETGIKNVAITPAQLYRALGHKDKPNREAIERIKEQARRLIQTYLKLTNKPEDDSTCRELGSKYPLVSIEGSLLPGKIVSIESGGNFLEVLILNDSLPLIDFARGRKQIDYIPVTALKGLTGGEYSTAPIYKYIIQRVLHMGHAANSDRILWRSVYEVCKVTPAVGAKRRKQMHDTREKTIKVLENLVAAGKIATFKVDTEGVTVTPKGGKSNDL